MAIKCLTPSQKSFLILAYKSKHKTQKQLAEYFHVSERSINRVLIEAGLATPVARIQGEAYQVMQLLKKNKMDLKALQSLLKDILGGCYVG